MSYIPLYPVAFALALALLLGVGNWLLGDSRWGRILVFTGVVHALGYVVVSRALYWTDALLPQQMLFAIVAIGITTKIVVFSPSLLARIASPTLEPRFKLRHITVGVAGSWLIQASLSLIFLFPTDSLGTVLVWLLPFNPVAVFLPLFLTGTAIVQVTMAGRVYEASLNVAPATDAEPTSAKNAEPGPAVAVDGGCDD